MLIVTVLFSVAVVAPITSTWYFCCGWFCCFVVVVVVCFYFPFLFAVFVSITVCLFAFGCILYDGKSSNTIPNLPKGYEAVVLSSNNHVLINAGIAEVEAFVMNPVMANVNDENQTLPPRI